MAQDAAPETLKCEDACRFETSPSRTRESHSTRKVASEYLEAHLAKVYGVEPGTRYRAFLEDVIDCVRNSQGPWIDAVSDIYSIDELGRRELY